MNEHYVTLLDSFFLPNLLALHHSLRNQAHGGWTLWVLALDPNLERSLESLNLEGVRCIPLADVEAEEPRLLKVKGDRSKGEYCWTLTPFTFEAVWRRAPEAGRVTYLDADIFFFRDPAVLLGELDQSGKQVMITEHAFHPSMERRGLKSGRFCVQFIPVVHSPGGLEVISWWKEKCLDWCYDRYEADRFGDQKYLDCWPARFPGIVHILQHPEWTQAPWNRDRFAPELPVMYHFQGFRLLTHRMAVLFYGGRIQQANQDLYPPYVGAFMEGVDLARRHGITINPQDYPWLKKMKAKWYLAWQGKAAFLRL